MLSFSTRRKDSTRQPSENSLEKGDPEERGQTGERMGVEVEDGATENKERTGKKEMRV